MVDSPDNGPVESGAGWVILSENYNLLGVQHSAFTNANSNIANPLKVGITSRN